jgi:protein-S-isoprenylcysteine O-methyltransferase Ste14
MDLPRHLFWVAALTGLWCAVHSLLITHAVRDAVRRLFPRYHVLHRLVYVGLSTATLVLLLTWLRTVPEQLLWDWTGWWAGVRWLGLGEAVLLFWLGARCYDGRTFLGLTQLRDFVAGRPAATPIFRQNGILGVIRHPWYTGTFLFLAFCLPVTDVNLVWRLVFALYLVVGTELEERKLLRELGDVYAAYRREVPRFFPVPRRRRRS